VGVSGREEPIGAGEGRPAATAAEALAALGSSLQAGLGGRQAVERLERIGSNDVPEKRPQPLLLFLRKFWGLSAWMLELIAGLSWVLQKYTDFGIALALLLLNAVISFFQEQRASAAVAALRSRLQVTSRVLRDGRWQILPARDLVPGDVVRLRTGDFVPVDARILEGDCASTSPP
jgi:H+-transporting ATPase